jgi:8-oxo-dGTP diphosphatase
MIQYVLGFAFTRDYAGLQRVLLIRKTKPEWQAGKLNGVGGKIEQDDYSAHRAMSREFKEETGLGSQPAAWTRFAVMEFRPDARVHVFVTWFDWKVFKQARTTTDERLEDYQVDLDFINKMKDQNAIPNLRWLIPMALATWQAGDTNFPVLQIYETDISKYWERLG